MHKVVVDRIKIGRLWDEEIYSNWCNSNCEGKYKENFYGINQREFEFESANDAIMFSLKWA